MTDMTIAEIAKRWGDCDPKTVRNRLKKAGVELTKSRSRDGRQFVVLIPTSEVERAEEEFNVLDETYSDEETQQRADAIIRAAFVTPAPHRVRQVPDSVEVPQPNVSSKEPSE